MTGSLWLLVAIGFQILGLLVFWELKEQWGPWTLWKWLYEHVECLRKKDGNANRKIPPRIEWLSRWTGIIERVLFAALTSFWISAMPTFILGWVALKTAVGWQDIWAGTAYGKARGTVGLWGTVVSLFIAVISGLFLRKALMTWDVNLAGFFNLWP
ncbi:MAG: hypothetical protein HYU29_08070 [Chloroflexi bacterium]|nr:hypothetical protein [Chloroflexota bacterium]